MIFKISVDATQRKQKTKVQIPTQILRSMPVVPHVQDQHKQALLLSATQCRRIFHTLNPLAGVWNISQYVHPVQVVVVFPSPSLPGRHQDLRAEALFVTDEKILGSSITVYNV